MTKTVIWILMLLSMCETVFNCSLGEPKCLTSRIFKMKSVDCHKKEIRTFPQCLPTDAQVIDLSVNRIRKLSAEDLKRYTSLKILYLNDNLIVTIDEDTFNDMSDLQTLDLSINALSKVPSMIFQLPSLKSLYLGQHLTMNIADVIENSKPITSPLATLDISWIYTEQQGDLPDLGIIPTLKKYNISGNVLSALSTKHIAGLCKLIILDTSNVSVKFQNECDCWTINRWLNERNVHFKPFHCDIDEHKCFQPVPLKDKQLFEKCVELHDELERKSQLTTILVPTFVVVGVIVIVMLICYYIFRKRRQIRANQVIRKNFNRTCAMNEEELLN